MAYLFPSSEFCHLSPNYVTELRRGRYAADAILILLDGIVRGLKVNASVVERNMEAEIRFMATENILMEAVKAGGDRQALHEKIRRHAMEAARKMKETGGPCDVLERMGADPDFAGVMKDPERFLEPKAFTGRSAEQVDAFLKKTVRPLLARRKDLLQGEAEEVAI